MDRKNLVRLLAEIAATAAETLDLQDVIDRVATSMRDLIPFDHIGVVRLEGERAVVHATTVRKEGCEPSCWEPTPLTDWSPRLRPRRGPVSRVEDSHQELDPSFPVDAEILAGGMRSSLWAPFHSSGSFTGGVWLSSEQPRAFSDEHQEALEPIAVLLGSAVEHWRIWDAERRRRERLDGWRRRSPAWPTASTCARCSTRCRRRCSRCSPTTCWCSPRTMATTAPSG